MIIPAVFYSILLVITATTISWTCYNFPLFPFQIDSLEWSSTWLLATVVDYYGSTLCLCGIIIATETSWIAKVLWPLGCCTLGSPICCLWILYKTVLQKQSLQLKPSSCQQQQEQSNENSQPMMNNNNIHLE
mmetsp:Transcript_37772/g.43145  ORF Transcript_37772/g.43145 Transcript_37772/m.43145 type:complete len:132 (-) Transcript_37772:250-645(-)